VGEQKGNKQLDRGPLATANGPSTKNQGHMTADNGQRTNDEGTGKGSFSPAKSCIGVDEEYPDKLLKIGQREMMTNNPDKLMKTNDRKRTRDEQSRLANENEEVIVKSAAASGYVIATTNVI
jgi:hypothetical protein